ncbi:hypothetical protein PR048_022042 [Dryococelus australis]|uniref:Uncharacterized protein n=1 Tax=Dryococelus australis TaxID=614101 RepID=A0ABQ9GZZ9_9NEOP|nr:hypothetical protein PR048_022042 [Dryococelus australis]
MEWSPRNHRRARKRPPDRWDKDMRRVAGVNWQRIAKDPFYLEKTIEILSEFLTPRGRIISRLSWLMMMMMMIQSLVTHHTYQPVARLAGELSQYTVANQTRGLFPEPRAANQRMRTSTSNEPPRPVSLLAYHQGELSSIPGRVTACFSQWESYRTMSLVSGFSRGSPVSLASPYSPKSLSSALKTHGMHTRYSNLATGISVLEIEVTASFFRLYVPTALNIEVLRADEGQARRVWSSAGMQGRGKLEIPEKTGRPAASSITPGFEPGSPRGMDRRGNPASKVKKRGSDTGDTNTHTWCLIVPTRKSCSVSVVTFQASIIVYSPVVLVRNPGPLLYCSLVDCEALRSWRVEPQADIRLDSRRVRSEVRMEQRRNARAGEAGNLPENPPTSSIIRHDFH